jgi:hypothetical protein
MKKLCLLIMISTVIFTDTLSQTTIKVVGDVDAKMVESQVVSSLDYLDIDDPMLLFIRFSDSMPAKLKGLTLCLPAHDSTQLFRISIDKRLNKAQRLNVLAHEMIHVRQYLSGDLEVIDGKMVWKGKTYPFAHRDPRKLPWEGEAHRYDQYLANVLREASEEKPPLLASEIEK